MNSTLPAALNAEGLPYNGQLKVYLSWVMVAKQKTLCLRFNAHVTAKPIRLNAYKLALEPDSIALTTRVGQAMLSSLRADLNTTFGLVEEYVYVTPFWVRLYLDKRGYERVEDRILRALAANDIDYALVDIFGEPVNGWRAWRLRAARRLKR